MRELYITLGIVRHASADEVKRAYRRLAHQYHPDKNPGDIAAEEHFKQIGRAYAILSNPRTRRRYDLLGPAGVGLHAGRPFSGSDIMQNVGSALSNLFEEVFGRPRQPRHTPPQPPLHHSLTVDLATAMSGGHINVSLGAPYPCGACVGSGCADGTAPRTCVLCRGSGSLCLAGGPFSITRRCPSCAGRGSFVPFPCRACLGRGTCHRQRAVQVRVPPGARTGTALRLRLPTHNSHSKQRLGEPTVEVYIDIVVAPHPLWARDGDDLRCTWPITMVEAALGSTVRLPMPAGAPALIEVPAGTQPGQVLRARGWGMPHLDRPGRGDLIIAVQVEIMAQPDEAATAHLRALDQLDQARHYPGRAAHIRGFAASWETAADGERKPKGM